MPQPMATGIQSAQRSLSAARIPAIPLIPQLNKNTHLHELTIFFTFPDRQKRFPQY
jgi:hypothetical protein